MEHMAKVRNLDPAYVSIIYKRNWERVEYYNKRYKRGEDIQHIGEYLFMNWFKKHVKAINRVAITVLERKGNGEKKKVLIVEKPKSR